MKKRLLTILSILFLISCFMFAGCLGDGDEKGTGRYWKLDTERTEYVFETGEKFAIPFAYIVDSLEDRVDGVKITYKAFNANGDSIRIKNDAITFPMRAGVCKIVYSAEGLEDYVLDCYVCSTLLSPSDYTLSDTTLTWGEVSGNVTGKYAVKINGGEETIVESNSFTSEIFDGEGWYVQVKSIGDKIGTLDSQYSVYQKRKELAKGELAVFNEKNYELDIAIGNPIEASRLPDPIEFIPECEGSTGGALKLGLTSGTYGRAIFTVNLQNSFDMANVPETGGLEIRFKVVSNAYVYGDGVTTTSTRFVITKPFDATAVQEGEVYLTDETNDQWLTLKVPVSTTNIAGAYKAGSEFSHLQFDLYNMARGGGYGELYLDYIKLYEDTLEAPTLTDTNGVITWDAVAEASGYTAIATVENNGVIEEITRELEETTLDLSSYSQYYVKVMANSGVAYKLSSNYSDALYKYAMPEDENVIAEFNSVFYKGVAYGFGSCKSSNVTYIPETQGTNDGAIQLDMKKENTGFVSMFTLVMPKPIDFASIPFGINIKLRVVSTPVEGLEQLRLYYVKPTFGPDSSEYTVRDTPDTYGLAVIPVGEEWAEVFISSSILKAGCFVTENGVTTLSLAVGYEGQNLRNGTTSIQFDSIEAAELNITEPDGVIASYNNKAYEYTAYGFGTTISTNVTYVPANAQDNHDGLIQLDMTKGAGGFISMFTLVLPKPLDLVANPMGIKIRLRALSTPVTDLEQLRLYYAKPTFGADQEYTVRSRPADFGIGLLSVGNTWSEIVISNKILESGCVVTENGVTTLSLAVGYEGFALKGGTTSVQIDSIEYYKIVEPANVIASFNYEGYTGMLTDRRTSTVKTPTYLQANANDGKGGHDGAIEFQITKSGGYVAEFNVVPLSAIDYSKITTGIKIRIRVSACEGVENLNLTLSADGSDKEYTTWKTQSIFAGGPIVVGGEWVELTLSKHQINSSSNAWIADGDSELSLALVDASGGKILNTTTVQIDYIEYI